MESVRKLSNLTFSGQKTELYQNILSHITLAITLFKGYKIIYLLVICNNTKDNFLREPEKINIKFHRN